MSVVHFGGGGGAAAGITGPHDDTLFGGATAHWIKTATLVEAITGGAGRDIAHGDPVYTQVTPGSALYTITTSDRQPGITPGLNAALKPTGDVTVAGWFSLQSLTVNNGHFLHAHATSQNALGTWALRYDTSGEVTFGWGNNTATLTGSVTSSGAAWTGLGDLIHVAATRSNTGDTAKIYINGELNNTTTGNSNVMSTTPTITCLGHSGGGVAYTTGMGSMVLYAGTALNDTQIQTLYQSCFA